MATLFEVPQRYKDDKAILAKSKPKKVTPSSVKGGGGTANRIALITAKVDTALGEYKDKYQLIQSEEVLHDYITESIVNGYISIDTETTGLDPMLDKLVGVCIYTRGQKGSYIPLGHIGYVTGNLLPNQLSIDFVSQEFERLFQNKLEIDMFNASFDIRVLRHNGMHSAYCTWDGYLAARLLNENEPTNGLKKLHQKYILGGEKDAFSFDELFNGVSFSNIPIETAYLYAANDPVITTELCDYQRQYLREDSDREDMRKLYWVLKNVEMPCVEAVANMEDNGVLLDIDYQKQLSTKYNQLLTEKLDAFYSLLSEYDKEIDAYKIKHTDNKLDEYTDVKLEVASITVTGAPSGQGIFKVTLKTVDGKALANKEITFSFNNKVIKVKTDANGVAKFSFNLNKAAKYPVSVAFLGDKHYKGAFTTATITVNPIKTKITAPKKTFKKSKKVKKVVITLKNSKGKALAKKKITLTVNKKKYTVKTNSKGKATFKIKNLKKKGTFKYTVKFAGDSLYKAVQKKGKIKVK